MEPAAIRAWRIVRDLGLGLLIGGAGAMLAWHWLSRTHDEERSALEAALARREALAAQAAAAQAAPVPAALTARPRHCDFDPMLPAASESDGRARLEQQFPADARARTRVLVETARRATQAGRVRDAEAALIEACRLRDPDTTVLTVPVADLMVALARHYAGPAARAAAAGLEDMIDERARQLLTASSEAYARLLGAQSARNQDVRRLLAALEQDADRTAVAVTERAPAAAAVPRSPAHAAEEAAPSPAALVASGPEFAQLEDDLARLRAQAQAVSADPAGFERRRARALADRGRCADAACLRSWYQRRRRELLAEF